MMLGETLMENGERMDYPIRSILTMLVTRAVRLRNKSVIRSSFGAGIPCGNVRMLDLSATVGTNNGVRRRGLTLFSVRHWAIP